MGTQNARVMRGAGKPDRRRRAGAWPPLLGALAILGAVGVTSGAVPPFWPEDNCVNTMNPPMPGIDMGWGTAAMNPYAGEFEVHTYPTGIQGGPMFNESTPCRLTARVGEVVSFNVVAEDVEEDDIVRIYVLEDPGLPNGATVAPDEYYQRCLPTVNESVGDGHSLGPCPVCQDSGMYYYGEPVIPPSAPGVATTIETWVQNVSTYRGGDVRTSIPVDMRPWCMQSSSGKPYGDGKAEHASQHGRLVSRKFNWTPLPAQGVCEDPVSCKYLVKFQAFDKFGSPSTVKSFEIAVQRSHPQYVAGTIGRTLSGPAEHYTDPVTGATSTVSRTPFETASNWMVSSRNYAAYVNCPLEITAGLEGARGYEVELAHTSPQLPPGASVEYRWQGEECADQPPGARDLWRDHDGLTCADYASRGWCEGGAAGPQWPGGSFRDRAQGGLIPADKACCACGAGSVAKCETFTSQATCMPDPAAPYNPLSNNTLYPRQMGCRWYKGACQGQARPYFIVPGSAGTAPWMAGGDVTRGRRVAAVFKWTPTRGMEGQEYRICFQGGDAQGMVHLPEVCAFVSVRRCYYCARVGETFKYIAEQYNFDTNWLRLWNYNPQVADPDLILRNYLPVAVGSTYEVQAGDTLSSIAARLRTTVKKILEVNPDMITTDIAEGQEVCVMPCTLNPYKDTPLNPYIPGAIDGVPPGFTEHVPRVSADPAFGGR
mmetsp:Transcript_38019/g.97162  ORF Transcript_38019/g.97162 Transcript_38019/m.97162 type:complete len:711 (-) Transcript_38019:13-2145(-)